MKHPSPPTFGHRYCAISLMMAQSAFLCSLLDTVCSERRLSVLGALFAVASPGLLKVSGLTGSTASAASASRAFWICPFCCEADGCCNHLGDWEKQHDCTPFQGFLAAALRVLLCGHARTCNPRRLCDFRGKAWRIILDSPRTRTLGNVVPVLGNFDLHLARRHHRAYRILLQILNDLEYSRNDRNLCSGSLANLDCTSPVQSSS